jgi:diguanylate cyclase (GGDEF)-like protein/PAS domain S-box-containing protein
MSVGAKFDFKSLAENSADIICSAGMDRVLRYVSPASLEILGWKPEEMAGKNFDDFILPEDMPILAAAFAGQSENATVRMRKKDGSAAWMENHSRLVRNSATGEPREHVVVMRDITDRKRQEEELSALALTDGPTGLSNRRAFEGALDMEWKRASRGRSQLSLLLLDIARLKAPHGENQQQDEDEWVRAVAGVVTGTVRATDFVARYGGAEIAVILPSVDITGAAKVAQKVRSAVKSLDGPKVENAEGGWLVANIGAATCPPRYCQNSTMPIALLMAADYALREAQHQGRNLSAWKADRTNFGGLIWPTTAP